MSNLRYLNKKILCSSLFEVLGWVDSKIVNGGYIKSVSPFTNEPIAENLQFTVSSLEQEPECITLAPLDTQKYKNVLSVENPKTSFFTIIIWLEKNIGFKPLFASHIETTANIHRTAYISEGVYIGKETYIGPGVVIYPNVRIGDNCIIEANSVIGNSGFGVVQEKSGNWMVPHIGGVVIGNNVRVGALTTVDRGTLGNTFIDDFTKIDDRVHIAHNCFIGKRNIICASASIGGSVNVGNDCWLGLGCNIRQKLHIADSSSIGIGANVFHNATNQTKLVGFPAKKVPH